MITSPRLHTIPIDRLLSSSIDKYTTETASPFETLKKVPFWKKLWHERQLKSLLNALFDNLDPYLSEIKEHADDPAGLSIETKEKVKTLILQYMEKIDRNRLLFDQPFLSVFVNEGYMDAAEAFLFRAKEEDAGLDNHEIFQALRNVWIMNSLQLYWDIPLALTDPIYAYSMLYPYTDNLLDNPDVSGEDKRTFNQKLADVLSGKKVTPAQPIEERIFELASLIQAHYPLAGYPEVTESIQLIHSAQVTSMRQGEPIPLTEADILSISFFKGGTSVLADAYLVKGQLTQENRLFAFQYGAFLQVLDDLQDKEEDSLDGTQTLFSTKTDPQAVDHEIRRLVSYIYAVNETSESDAQNTGFMKEVISQCTLLMVMDAVGRNPEAVTRGFYKELSSYSKVRLTFYKQMAHKLSELVKA